MNYLLFVRAMGDLGRACHEVNEYFAFRGRHSSLAPHRLHGAWIGESALSCIPFTSASPSRAANERCILNQESFGVSGIWELARIHVPSTLANAQRLPDAIIDALRDIAGAEAGLFAPAFFSDISESAAREEFDRLHARYPGALAPPLIQDADTGELRMKRRRIYPCLVSGN